MYAHEITQDGISYVPCKVAGKRVGLSADYIARFCREGLVAATRHAGAWYVDENSLQAYLAEQERQREVYRWKLSAEAKEEAERAKFSAADMIAPYPPQRKRSGKLAEVALATLTLFAVTVSGALAFQNIAPEKFAAAINLGSTAREQFAAAATSLPWLGAVASNIYRAVCPFVSSCEDAQEKGAQPVPQPKQPPIASQKSIATSTPATSPPRAASPTTVINQPVVDRIRETVRTVVEPGVNASYVDERLSVLESSLLQKISGVSSSASNSITQVYTTVGQMGRIEHLDDVNLTDPTITRGTLTSVRISSLSAPLSISDGGTGTSTGPSYGKVLLGNSSGAYDLVATSSLGITGSGSSGADFGKTFELASGALSPTTTVGLIISASSTFNGGISFDRSTTTSATSTNFFATYASTTNATSTNFFATLGRFTSAIADALTATAATITSLTSTTITATNASTTVVSAYDGVFVGRTSTTTILGSATSTFGAGIQTTALNVTSNSATSTFANGIQLSGGCFRMPNGSCAGAGGGGGTVTSVDASGGSTGLSFSGGPVTGAGTLTLSGTLVAANGGTGWSNIQSGALLYGNGTGALATTTQGTGGQVLAWLSGTPTWTATSTLATITGTLAVSKGGTGITSTPTYGQLLVGDGAGYTLTATSTLGIALSDTTGTLAATRGGTGLSSVTANQLLVGSAGNTWTQIATSSLNINTDNLVQGSSNLFYANSLVQLFIHSSSTIPKTYSSNIFTGSNAFTSLTLGSLDGPLHANAGVLSATSSIGILYGGTGATTASGARTNLSAAASGANSDITSLSGLTTALTVAQGGSGWAAIQSGSIPYGNGSSAFSTTTAGTAGQVLALLNGVPTWAATTTLSTIGGTLAVSQGGTGQTTLTGIVKGNGTSAFTAAVSGTDYVAPATTITAGSGLTGGGDLSTNRTLSLDLTNANTWTGLQRFSNASSTLFSTLDALYIGRTATTTIRGDGVASIIPYASTTAITATTASTTNLIISSSGGTGTRCLQVGADGTVSANASACGSGSSIGEAWAIGGNGFTGFLAPTTTQKLWLGQASSTLLSVMNTAYFGGSATTTFTQSGNALFPTSGYVNFGATEGTSGYGFRDNSGTLEFKNSGGSWQGVTTATSGPSFSVHKNGTNQTVTTNTPTLLTWSTETFDTNNNFASNRFTPTIPGKYIVTLGMLCGVDQTGFCEVWIYKNGSAITNNYNRSTSNTAAVTTIVVDMNGTTDYLEAYGANGGGTTIDGIASNTNFTGALIAPVSATAGGWQNDGTQSFLTDSTDFVGIGTSTPWAKLSIDAPAGVNSFAIGSSTATYFLVNSSGNVGIGNTGPVSKLELPTTGGDIAMGYYSGLGADGLVRIGLAGNSGSWADNSGTANIYFQRDTINDGSNHIGFVTYNAAGSNTTRMVIDKAGNVGVGTTSPVTKLSVLGTNHSTFGLLSLVDSGGANAGIMLQNASGLGSAYGQANITLTNAANAQGLAFGLGGTTYMTLSGYPTAGNVGIGTTTPGQKLHIEGNAAAVLRFNDTSASGQIWDIGSAYSGVGTAGTFIIADRTQSATPFFTINSAGSVGIGTTTPLQKFSVDGISLFGYGNVGTLGRVGVKFDSSTEQGISIQTTNSSASGHYVRFANSAATLIGGISKGGDDASVVYNTTSDLRLKENIATTTKGLATLMQIPVRDFNFISDPNKLREQGYVAQELYPLYPEAVSVGGESATSSPWSVDYGRITPLLAKSIQDLNLKLEDLATTTPEIVEGSFTGRFLSSLFARITQWLADASNGIENLYARVFKGERGEFQELCVDDICVTRDEFLRMKEGQSATAGAPAHVDFSGAPSDSSAPGEDGADTATATTSAEAVPITSDVSSTQEVPPAANGNDDTGGGSADAPAAEVEPAPNPVGESAPAAANDNEPIVEQSPAVNE